jgi:hypothetical protein
MPLYASIGLASPVMSNILEFLDVQISSKSIGSKKEV